MKPICLASDLRPGIRGFIFRLRRLAGGLLLAGLLAISLAASSPTPATTRIALVSDTHVDQGTNAATYRAHMEKVIAAVNDAAVDLVVIAGDLTEHGSPKERAVFRAQIKAFRAPVWYVPGNHDVGDKPLKGTPSEVSFQRVVNYELSFGRSWFERKHAGIRVLGLNSALFESGLPQEKRMWKFLEKNLAVQDNFPTLVLMHHPLYVKTPNEPGGTYWNLEPRSRQRLLGLLRQGGVKAVLSGHLHYPLQQQNDGLQLITTLPVSFGLPAKKQPVGWTLVTIADGAITAAIRTVSAP